MDKGPVERFLDEVKAQRQLTAALERDRERIREEVMSLKSPVMGEKVQTSRQSDLSDAVIRLEAAEKKVGLQLRRLVTMRNEARRLIERESDPKRRAVLYSWYLMDETMETIAEAMHISERHAWRMKSEALCHLERIAADMGLNL